jgi:hypothetical protein
VAADQIQEAGVQRARVVQGAAARAGAAQREDGAVAVPVAHGLKAFRHGAHGLRPRDLAKLPGAARAATHERPREAVLGVQLARGLKAARAAAQEATAGRVVADTCDAAVLDGSQQRAAAAAVAVTGDGQTYAHGDLRCVSDA